MSALFPTAYFPSIGYMKLLLQAEQPVIEIWDTYHKQTFRNRCQVMTANGVQALSIPVKKVNGNHTMTKDMAISPIEPWQQIHRRCLESAYKASPYFDHYYGYIAPVFETKFEKLIDVNDAALKAVFKMLKLNMEIAYSTDYVHETEHDFRDLLSSKNVDLGLQFPPYYQVFCNKYPFAPDLSILDLIFNEGPEAKNHLLKTI